MWVGVWGLGFGVRGSGFGVWGLGFGVLGLGFGLLGFVFGGFEVLGLGLNISSSLPSSKSFGNSELLDTTRSRFLRYRGTLLTRKLIPLPKVYA